MRFVKLPPDQEKKPFSPKAKRHFLLLVLNTVLFFGVYRVLIHLATGAETAFWSFLVMLLYAALLVGFFIAYMVYNRFLSRKGLTPQDLDPSWSEEQKREFLADGEARLERSKWMMTIILPLILTFLFDVIDLFFIKGVLAR